MWISGRKQDDKLVVPQTPERSEDSPHSSCSKAEVVSTLNLTGMVVLDNMAVKVRIMIS